MTHTRREMIKGVGALASATALDLAASRTAPAANVSPVRLPLPEFVQSPDLVAALRKGVKAMKARKPSDPLSWFYQAAIHGVPQDKVDEATKLDPDVAKVDARKYWNQCPHFGQSSANFLPWHRGYTYYFERILRLHTGRPDFALPYWNYTEPTNDRRFPKVYGIQYLDDNLNNNDPDNINPLWEEERDFYFTTYQHPLTKNLPLLSLTDEAVDVSLSMTSSVFFGKTEQTGLGGGLGDTDPGTRGLLESYPHDQIHRAVGGVIGSHAGAMATPPTAGFDPIFSVHHTNVDWLWVKWACSPGKSWGELPPEAWFEERPWFFFDEQGSEVNESRRHFFDHRKLGIRFKYEDLKCTPLELPAPNGAPSSSALAKPAATSTLITKLNTRVRAVPNSFTAVPLGAAVGSLLTSPLSKLALQPKAAAAAKGRLVLRFNDIEFETIPSVGFDVHITAGQQSGLSRSHPSFAGSIHLFNHRHPGMPLSQDFDVSRMLSDVKGGLAGLTIVFVPYPLLKVSDTAAPFLHSRPLSVNGIEFRMIE